MRCEMSKDKTKNYFDKFIDDQLQRSQQNLERRQAHQVHEDDDKKRTKKKMTIKKMIELRE